MLSKPLTPHFGSPLEGRIFRGKRPTRFSGLGSRVGDVNSTSRCPSEVIVDVVIPVEAEAAAALTDIRKREAVGRIVSRILRPQPDHDPLVEAMERLSADAKAKGLTAETLDTELAAHKAERAR